ncbi:carbohydrate binding family 9 domain-containing protein [Aureitalea sp. L0-47]|uniref:carbohydrate binding family 9 domain-containing protein n=1 Tax=Aureitalea sp. L0-47 TaxID=2816962 RepID=UPI00223720E7|nr:carbohydrate binding family 9 domain-containing protein [Aureitalea sp. L0-47]MCW5520536.1 carbohydrate binding family 9 domain-containing protein [Aureitalea sp. L0-47]
MRKITIALLLFFSIQIYAQDKKSMEAIRVNEAPTIDGVLDDTFWDSLPTYGDFNMYEPGNEGEVDSKYNTEVKMAYDDNNVYVAAYMYDPDPSTILTQFSQRDEVFVQADRFSIALNTYNDGINETHFFVTAAGTIGDARAERNDFDFGYNVVFECKTSMDEKGWYAEFRIPYNALRFPQQPEQDWGINFYRRINHINETHTWNLIDITTGSESLYSGNVTGVRDIDPPIRLTLFPFAQGLVSDNDGETETNFSAGMDVKYGLSDSFTLDATLIPDFGQVAFDEVRLNLGPFEQTFNENRQFFTEGVELFNKGRIFFSRRIGNEPSGPLEDLNENEEYDEFPNKVNLLNALKVSGRTQKKLGIGVLNAITERTYARATDTITGISRKLLVEPLANYNIFVLDQQFNDNSSVSLINSNVTREGSFRDSNVTGLVFDIADKGNNFRFSGRGIMSNVSEIDVNTTGIRTELDIFRIKGRFRYRVGHDFADTELDINDLGLNFRNNFNNFTVGMSYQIFEPTNTFNEYRFSFTARHRRLYRPSVQTSNNFDLNWFFLTTERFAFGGFVGFNSDNDDYFEPRVDGKFVTFSSNLGGRLWCSSDYRKKFAYDIGIGHRTWFEDPQVGWFFDASPRYRFSDKFLVVLATDLSFREDQFGYIDDDGVDVFMGQRDIINIENVITASYNFDPYKAIDLRFRNFWSTADYSDDIFFILNDDGSRTEFDYDTSENDPNRNFNIWNLDLSFRWRFAPGSEATLLYRNQIFNLDELATLNYQESLDNLFAQPQQNTVSLRITYFIDYNNVKGLFKKNS